jgi:glycosyltransferase involved in cell wall biosynthesis
VWHPPVAYLRTQAPVFMFQDSPFEIIQPLYDGMSHYTPKIMEEVRLVERMAAKRCTGIIETSEWAAAEARKLWRLPEEKVAAIPFGANVQTTVDAANLDSVIEARSKDELRLLFLGKDWDRKGGDLALQTAKVLNDRGVKAKLVVVGCQVPGSKPEYLEEVGFIDKKTPEGRQKLDELLRGCHALVLPTKAEAFGIVYLEAAAFGMPSLAPDVMGVGSAVLDGITGKLLPIGATAEDYASVLQGWRSDPESYRAVCQSAHRAYLEKFTWPQVAKEIREFMLARV